MTISEHQLAINVAKSEGGKESLSIAQIKEVIHATLIELTYGKPSDVLKLVEKHESEAD